MFKTLITVAALLVATPAYADKIEYPTYTQYFNNANTDYIVFPSADTYKYIRVVKVLYSGEVIVLSQDEPFTDFENDTAWVGRNLIADFTVKINDKDDVDANE